MSDRRFRLALLRRSRTARLRDVDAELRFHLEERVDELVAAGVPRDRLIVVPDPQSGLKMLQDGRIDAYSLPVLSLNELLAKSGDAGLEIFAPVKDAPVYCDGAAFNKKDTALRDAFDVELAKMKQSGDFAKIVEPYGFSAEAAMSTDRDKLCAAPQ